MNKRRRPDSNAPPQSMTEQEKILYELIKSKQDMGIWSRDMKRETNIPDNVVTKSLKTLIARGLIKEVVNVQYKGRKHYMACEFEPSAEITGGAWYNEGNLDTEFINFLKRQCLGHIYKLEVATLDMVADAVKRSRVLKGEYSIQQIGEIARALVLDNDVIEVRSSGIGEFASIRVGSICFKCTRPPGTAKELKVAAMATIPCGVCPNISHCTPDGILSPTTCEYYTKWLEF